jgi:uncharacterized Rmd1/YagE family protein
MSDGSPPTPGATGALGSPSASRSGSSDGGGGGGSESDADTPDDAASSLLTVATDPAAAVLPAAYLSPRARPVSGCWPAGSSPIPTIPELALRKKRGDAVTFAATEATFVPAPIRLMSSEEEESEEPVSDSDYPSSGPLPSRGVGGGGGVRRRHRGGPGDGGTSGIVSVVATADSYKMKELRKYFQPADLPAPFYDVVVLHLPAYAGEEETVVFFFSYGVTTWWGSDRVGQKVIKQLKSFEVKSEPAVIYELYPYSYRFGDGTDRLRPRPQVVRGDHFYLENATVDLKLAIASALAQSLKLMVLENRIDQVIQQTDKYPSILQKEGSVRLALPETAKLKGHLFVHRMTVNLHSDILDTPTFIWEHSELKPVYLEARQYMEIDQRVEVLNQRLVIVDEMFAVLNTVQNGTHAVKLELIVLSVIFFNVIFAVCLLARQYFRP